MSKAAGLVGPPLNQWQGPARGTGFLQMIDQFLMAVCGGIPWQAYFQRVLASKTVFDAKILSFMTALGCLAVSVPAIVIGGIAKNANFTAAGYDGPYNLRENEHVQVLALAMQWLCPGMVSVFGLNALIGSIMSSVDSSVLSAATLVTRNIYQFVIRPTATDVEISVVLRSMVCLLGGLSAFLALSVTSVTDLRIAASDVVFVLLFPQLLSLFYLNKLTNSYGAFAGFTVGAVLRALCGERSLGIPVVLQLPMYDGARDEQRFPFRTLCMLTNLSTTMIASHVAQVCFGRGWLPDSLDVCGCFGRGPGRQRGASFFEFRERSASLFSSPEGLTSKIAGEPPSHVEGAAALTSPDNVDERLSPSTSDEANEHPTNTTVAKDQPTRAAEAKDQLANTAEAKDRPARTAKAKGHPTHTAKAKRGSLPRKSSVSAKKKRRASKPEGGTD
ncbi:high-affinity choline transporter 1-like [Dermacentor andersoni]|uniref:high-affinity choline transporter 1-like n=1 Tax=Dermacentor andersoni TaxID=34620 RepID=UPI003B3AB807